MAKRILFLIPPKMFNYQQFSNSVISSSSVSSSVPYGVLSIATYLKKYSIVELSIKIYDFSILPNAPDQIETQVKKAVVEFKPDIIGISALFSLMYDSVQYFCDMVKQLEASVITIAGGACATNDYAKLLEDIDTLDAVCYSEGEKPFLRLVNAPDSFELLDNDIAWVTRNSLAKGRMPAADYIVNLDEIPFLDYSLIDYKSYKPSIDFNAFSDLKNSDPNSVYLSIHTTRGCPFNCIFCAANALHGRKMRFMSARHTVDNITDMINRFKLTHLTIEDDQFLIDKNRAKIILGGISKIRPKIQVCISAVTVSFIDEEIAILMKEIGINKINLAVEHGSEYVLKHIIEKPFTIPQLHNAVAALKKHDISPIFLIVTGLPGEREEDRNETVRLIKHLGIDWTIFHTATPFKGSRLYDICMENGYVCEADINNCDMKNAVINTPEMSADYISQKTYLMNLELNFVHNHRIKIGDFKAALIWLKEVARKYPRHAFAHYYMAKAYRGLNDHPKASEHHRSFKQIVSDSKDWHAYAAHFGLI